MKMMDFIIGNLSFIYVPLDVSGLVELLLFFVALDVVAHYFFDASMAVELVGV
jgi:hypothetical protein